jgi:hypothetical protein
VSMCHYVSLPTYGKEYCPYSQNSLTDTSRDWGYIKPPSTNSVRAVWVSWQRVRFLGETHRVQYCAGAKKNEFFGTFKSFHINDF